MFQFLDYDAAYRLLLDMIDTHPDDCACAPSPARPLWVGEHDGPPEPCQAECGAWIEPGAPFALLDGQRTCFDCADAAEKRWAGSPHTRG